MADPRHARKTVVHRIQSTNSRGAMIQSSPTKNSRRTVCHLPVIQTKTGLHKSKSVPLVVEPLTFTDLSENWPFEVPQSAPPVMKPEPVFVWSSPENPSQDVVFGEWSNGTAVVSPSSSRHQDGDCSIRMASGDKQRRSERAANPHDKFRAQNSADGATTTEGHTMWSRKPPHHLPPLDPSVFETKSKSVMAVSSREKKPKRCVNRPTEMESSRKMSSQKDSKNANRTENGFRIPAEKNELSHKQSSVTSHSIKQTSRPPCMYHSVVSGNDDLPFHGMSQRAQNIVPSKYEARALRRSISISSSIEHLLSKETGVDARAGISKGFSIQKSRALGPSLRSTAPLPLKPGTTSSGKSSNGFLIRRKAVVNAPAITTYECDRAGNSRTTRGENSNLSPFQVTPAIPTEFQAAGNAAEESHVVGELPKRNPRPGASSLNSCAYWTERKVGMCSDQSATEGKNRTHARVLLKKFGTLDIKEN